MKRLYFHTLLILAFAFASSCASGPSKTDMAKEIESIEKTLYNKEKPVDINNADQKTNFESAVDNYKQYANAFTEDEQSPEYLFKAAEIQRSLKNYTDAIETYRHIKDKYPDHEKAAHCLFLLGFSYENDLKDLNKAKELYNQFLEKYPDHQLAESVSFSLKHLGKSPEDIIKEFEKNIQKPKPAAAPNADGKPAAAAPSTEKTVVKETAATSTEPKKIEIKVNKATEN